ncbi:MAG TPA: hypothetical protein VHZ02_16980 [Acidimicrobiales bacterium]|nr:hypothetical protein [Acidimicrobiales bacterium]
MMDSTTGRARPLVAVGYGPRCVPVMQLAEAAAGLCDWRDGSGNHIVAVVGSTDDEEQLRAAYRLLRQEVPVTYTDERH